MTTDAPKHWKGILADLIDAETVECSGRLGDPNCHANDIIAYVRGLLDEERKAGIIEGREWMYEALRREMNEQKEV